MILMHHLMKLAFAWLGVVLILLVLGPGSSRVTAGSHCQINVSRGWANGNGRALIIMKNTGQPCSTVLYADPDSATPVTAIHVITQPQHGVITLNGPRFFYLPNPGYLGRDRFELGAEGVFRGRRVSLSGEVLVAVNP